MPALLKEALQLLTTLTSAEAILVGLHSVTKFWANSDDPECSAGRHHAQHVFLQAGSLPAVIRHLNGTGTSGATPDPASAALIAALPEMHSGWIVLGGKSE